MVSGGSPVQPNASLVADMEFVEVHEALSGARSAVDRGAAASNFESAARLMIEAAALIDRQMTALSTEAPKWRAAATDLSVTGALSDDPKIESAMFRIADAYDNLAFWAEQRYLTYSKTRLRRFSAFDRSGGSR
jgi:hypothetical protein